MNSYICYSGGANGSDFQWKNIGYEFGVQTIDFTVNSLKKYPELTEEIENYYNLALNILQRPKLDKDSYGGQLVRRNYLQVKFSDAIYAIGDLVGTGVKDKKGFVNKSNFTVVSGGTAYAVTYGILLNKYVYVFNQSDNMWYSWYRKGWVLHNNPTLKFNFTGIGTREITTKGIAAIKELYKNNIK